MRELLELKKKNLQNIHVILLIRTYIEGCPPMNSGVTDIHLGGVEG